MEHHEAIIASVCKKLRERYPQWMQETVEPYLGDIEHGGFNFSSLLGETQQGKTLVMHIITWLMIHKHGYTACYITKKLSSLRDDALDKLKNGAINTIVDEVCADLNVTRLSKEYKLDGYVAINSKAKSKAKGNIPIYLMQPENNNAVLRWMNSLGDSKIIYFIDEVHELYSIKDYFKTGGLSTTYIEQGKVHNHALIHMIAKKCREQESAMLGVTATPQRMLTSDPSVYPSKLYSIPMMPPAHGLCRVGYNAMTDSFLGATFHPEINVIEVVNSVMARQNTILSSGNVEIKFLNIVDTHYNSGMTDIMNTIKATCKNVYVKLFMQQGSDAHNNVESLDDFFDLTKVPDEVLLNGVMILIGKSREAAGITIKPSFGLLNKGLSRKKVGQTTYEIAGITDMLIKMPDNLETAEQLIGRASGWFDSNHHVHIWIPEPQIDDANYGISHTKRNMVAQYDGTRGPISLLSVKNYCNSIKHFCPNKLYKAPKADVTITYVNEPCYNQFDTAVTRLPDSLFADYNKVCLLPNRGRTSEGKAVHRKIKAIMSKQTGHDIDLHIAWDENQVQLIEKAVVTPSDDYRVNGYVVVMCDHLLLVSFINQWNEREFSEDACWNISLDKSRYAFATRINLMSHKNEDAINNWELSDEHYKTLNNISEILKKPLAHKKSLYNYFSKAHTVRGANKLRPADIAYQTWLSQRWTNFKSSYISLYNELDDLIKASDPSEDLFTVINSRFNEFFEGKTLVRPQVSLPKIETFKGLKIKLKPLKVLSVK